MRSVSVRLCDLEKVTIPLGFVGENIFTKVYIDCKKIFDEYPDAVPTLAVVPPQGDAYPAVVTKECDMVIWEITASDLIYKGSGEIQLSFIQDEMVWKTWTAKTKVYKSIEPSGEVPEPIQNWLTQASATLALVDEAIELIPQTIDEEISKIIDDTAGTGDTNKVWSASKSSELKNDLMDSGVAIIEAIDITDSLEIGKFYWNNGTKTANNDIESCEKIQCHEGDSYTINANRFGVFHQINLWDALGNWSYLNCSDGYESYTYTCTASDAYISFSSGKNTEYPLVVKINTITDKYEMIKKNRDDIDDLSLKVDDSLQKSEIEYVGNLRFVSEFMENRYVAAGNNPYIATADGAVIAKIPVESGKTVSFTCRVTGATYNGAYFNGDTPIGYFSYASCYNSENDCYTLTVPANCTFIGITAKLGSTDDTSRFVAMYGNKIDDELKEIYDVITILGRNIIDSDSRGMIESLDERITEAVANNRLYGKKITLFGDSITEYPNAWALTPWAKLIADRTECVMQNLAVSGSGFKAGTTYQARLSLVASDVKMIGVSMSFNDIGQDIGEISDSTSATVCGCANMFFDALQTAYPAIPIICYVQNPWENYRVGQTQSDNLVTKISEICLNKGIPFYGEMYLNGSVLRPWVAANREVYFKGDNPDHQTMYNVTNAVHPNSEGGKAIANHLQRFFEQNIV